MFKSIARAVGHFLLVSVVLLAIAICVGISQHASINLGDAPLAYKVGGEGPLVFFENNQMAVSYIRGSREEGFSVETNYYAKHESIPASVFFALDESSFSFVLNEPADTPPAVYNDDEPILAISDLEGNFHTFRKFLLAHGVITQTYDWQFGKGHLVLVGDMVDRGQSTTQLLWFIYKLEQQALLAGGRVHYILGNHEIKNLQGNMQSAADKYTPIAGFVGKSTAGLFADDAFWGRWLAAKNTVEMINGHIFVHGGLHPDVVKHQWHINAMNQRIRAHYRQMYYPGLADEKTASLLSTETGPAWFRGYLRGEVSNDEFERILTFYDAKSISVGHTLQFSVNSQFNNRLFAIDVKHPDDYRASFPIKSSEGLLIDGERFYRLTDDGEKHQL
ncbi:metallophosphoesterase [Alteromonas sp. AMM-1]|uniref:metallophosphoesterase n=1 Tax=Alteromonas sp. AMM-1 TaxID=3394233 RepID=UPI0039A53DE5